MKTSAFGRFLIAGAINTLVTYVLFLALSSVLHHAIAYTIAYVAGIGLAYVMAASFVFGAGFTAKSAARFPVVYLIQYLFGLGALALLIDWLGMSRQLAMLLVVATSLPLTFVLSKRAMNHKTDQIP